MSDSRLKKRVSFQFRTYGFDQTIETLGVAFPGSQAYNSERIIPLVVIISLTEGSKLPTGKDYTILMIWLAVETYFLIKVKNIKLVVQSLYVMNSEVTNRL